MLPYSRRLDPAKSDAAAKEVKRTLPSPVPGGTSSAALYEAVRFLVRNYTLLSAGSPRPPSTFCAAPQRACAPDATLALPRPRRLATRTAQDFSAHHPRL